MISCRQLLSHISVIDSYWLCYWFEFGIQKKRAANEVKECEQADVIQQHRRRHDSFWSNNRYGRSLSRYALLSLLTSEISSRYEVETWKQLNAGWGGVGGGKWGEFQGQFAKLAIEWLKLVEMKQIVENCSEIRKKLAKFDWKLGKFRRGGATKKLVWNFDWKLAPNFDLKWMEIDYSLILVKLATNFD